MAILIAVVAAFAMAVAEPVTAATRRVPFGFFGTVLDPEFNDPATVSDRALDGQTALMARSGVESIRLTFPWNEIEPAPGTFDFGATDRLIGDAARHGIVPLANLIYTPTWASSHPAGLYPFRYAPTSPQLFANFASAVVHRYGPHGTFWKLNPKLPRDPVRQWQIWNEQAFDVFWATLPWAPSYTRMLRAAYTSIHRADHGAKVVAGSLVATNRYTQWAQLSDLYRAGAKRYFDVVAVHPFTDGSIPVSQSIGRVITIVKLVRDVMRRHGDGRKPVILTELTWPGAVGFVKRSRLLGLETTPRGEILRLKAVYNYLSTHRGQTGVTEAFWYDWASSFNANDPQSDVGYRFAGLTRFAKGAFIVQPVLRAYAQIAAHYEGCRKGSNARRCS
jgi:Beta-galactosidase